MASKFFLPFILTGFWLFFPFSREFVFGQEGDKEFNITTKYKAKDYFYYSGTINSVEEMKIPFLKGEKGSIRKKNHLTTQKGVYVREVYKSGMALLIVQEIYKARGASGTDEIVSFVLPEMKVLAKPDGSLINLFARSKFVYEMEKAKKSPVDVDLSEMSFTLGTGTVKIGQEFVQEEDQPHYQFMRHYKVAGLEEVQGHACLKIFFKEKGQVLLPGDNPAEKESAGILWFAHEQGRLVQIMEQGDITSHHTLKINSQSLPATRHLNFSNAVVLKETGRIR